MLAIVWFVVGLVLLAVFGVVPVIMTRRLAAYVAAEASAHERTR